METNCILVIQNLFHILGITLQLNIDRETSAHMKISRSITYDERSLK